MAGGGGSSSESFARKVFSFCRTHTIFHGGERVLVAVSGGGDSVALLHCLADSPFHLDLVVVHLNHLLRGDESDADEHFVRSLSHGLNLPFVSRAVDVRARAVSERLSLEDAGRAARYELFLSLKDELSADLVALAHHLDDQAETVLLRLLRGSGGRGLSGIPPRDPRGVVRPFLGVTRDEIRCYLTERGIPWREDETNADTTISLRNRVRHHLLPILREYNPRIDRRLAVTAEILAADDRHLDHEAGEIFQRAHRSDGRRITLETTTLLSLPTAIVRRVLRHACAALTGTTRRLSADHIEACIRSAREGASGIITLPGGVIVELSGGVISLTLGGGRDLPIPETVIAGEGAHPLPDGRIVTVTIETSPDLTRALSDNEVMLPCSVAPFPLLVRGRRPGDRIRIAGGGHKLLKKLFQERMIPRWERERVLILEGKEILWVVGVATIPFPPTPGGALHVRVTSPPAASP